MMTQFLGGAVDYSDNPVLPPWYVPGWSAQLANTQAFTLAAPPSSFPFSNLPNTIPFVNVIGSYLDGSGNSLGGYLTFEQSEDLLLVTPVNGVNTTFRMPKRFVGTVPSQFQNLLAWNSQGSGKIYIQFGTLSVMLMPTDTAGITIQEPFDETQEGDFVQPLTWVYHVKEYFYRGYMYDITVPTAQGSTPVDINSLIVPGTYVRNDDWNRGF